ncbi:peptidase M24, structural domain-containing protein [Gigaspora rosea]|uniref:Methionine aminopeptidase n=1 Tax=Gigaspora rosea TaxID=44941 RepID=A0A397VPS1_9GLOM|nr:peptidase M24, structural domain-containing protein [Gigaspora rosea]
MSSVQLCRGQDCTNPSKLQCPTCLKLSINDSYFCSQECFKKNWSTHKLLHKTNTPNTGVETYIPNFPYTGSLRAVYPLSPRRSIPSHIKKPEYADDPKGVPKSEMNNQNSIIQVLNNDEIEAMRKVCKLAREVLDIGAAAIKPGVTTDEIDRIVHEAAIERDCYPSPLNYYEFPKSVCTSVNEVICHGIPDRRELKEGDIINLDVTLYHDGFHGDLNETYPVGIINTDSQKLIKTAKECLNKAIECVKPGFLYRDLGAVIEKNAKANNCSVVRTYCGHGIHRLFHCPPNVPHYTKNKAVGKMKPGHVFTIEPMINFGAFVICLLGIWRDRHWPDNWTAVTEDGKRSAQFEHTLLVTETGVEILTAGKDERRFYPDN